MKQEPPKEKLKLVIGSEMLSSRVRELGENISRDYSAQEIVLLSVLRGSVYFTVDLSRQLTIPFILDFIGISSYGGSSDPSGVVRITKDLETNIYRRHVLVIEGIVDTGLSLGYLLRNLKARQPASLGVCALLNVEARRIVEMDIDYKGFDLPNIFVVGYGLDYNERYRQLDYVAELQGT